MKQTKEKQMHKNVVLHKTIEVLPNDPDISEELLGDLNQARQDIKEIAAIGKEAVKEAADLAFQSQHDKLYMALSSVMKSTIEANRELIDVHKSKRELMGTTANTEQITNNLFVGSTAELLDLLDKEKK
jgi:hypothetical protein